MLFYKTFLFVWGFFCNCDIKECDLKDSDQYWMSLDINITNLYKGIKGEFYVYFD